MWERAISEEGDWFAFFEDDVQVQSGPQLNRLQQTVRAALAGALNSVCNIELSKSFSLRELGLEGKHSSELDFGGARLLVFPYAATNTTCASLLKRDLIEALIESWSPSCRFIPVDLYVRVVAMEKGFQSAFLLDGLSHGSSFRPKRFG
jgi:hypothetical protein